MKAYKEWKKQGSIIEDIKNNLKLIEFASHIIAIKEYEKDWNNDKCKREVIKRLTKADSVEGMLFEFHEGSHFVAQNLKVHWIPNIGDEKLSDLKIITNTGDTILIECTFRKPSFARVLMDSEILKDLLRSAKDKLESKHDYGKARIVIVKIPEEIDWSNSALKSKIDLACNSWFLQKRMSSVNAILFMGVAKYIRVLLGDGPLKQVAYEPDQFVYMVPNPKPIYAISSEINLVRKI